MKEECLRHVSTGKDLSTNVGTGPLLRGDGTAVKSEPLVVQTISVEGTVRAGGVEALPGMQGMEAWLGVEEKRR